MMGYHSFLRPSVKTGSTDQGLSSKKNKSDAVDGLQLLPKDSIYRFSFPDIFGEKVDFLQSFVGRVSLVINVACN